MTRRDEHMNAMLRHLGAAYYESLHGRATSADVARALDAVEEHNGISRAPPRPGTRLAPRTQPLRASGGHLADKDPLGHRVRWRQRVRDVMTTKVITVDRITPYKEIAALLAKHKISAVPVLMLGRHVGWRGLRGGPARRPAEAGAGRARGHRGRAAPYPPP